MVGEVASNFFSIFYYYLFVCVCLCAGGVFVLGILIGVDGGKRVRNHYNFDETKLHCPRFIVSSQIKFNLLVETVKIYIKFVWIVISNFFFHC